MRYTHTSKPTSKCSTYTICRIFGTFSSSINKILLDAQIKEYYTEKSTRQNTYDEEHNNIEITPTAPHCHPYHKTIHYHKFPVISET